jgi:hypothetical protein
MATAKYKQTPNTQPTLKSGDTNPPALAQLRLCMLERKRVNRQKKDTDTQKKQTTPNITPNPHESSAKT